MPGLPAVHDIYLEIGRRECLPVPSPGPAGAGRGRMRKRPGQALYDAAPRYVPIAPSAALTFNLPGAQKRE